MTLKEQLIIELKKIDISQLTVNGIVEIKMHKSIVRHSRYIGTEFDATLKKIIYYINQIPISSLSSYRLKFGSDNELIGKYGDHERSDYCPNFELNHFIKHYDFQSNFSYHIENIDEIKKIQKHLNFLIKKIDLKLFTAVEKIQLGLKVGCEWNVLNDGFADLIIDDSLIDIKSGLKINGKNTENIAQLLFYFFMIQLTINQLSENQRNKHHKINKIGFYYAAYNKLIEVEVNKLIPNINIILILIKQLLIKGNVRIREIIKHSIITRDQLNVLTDEQIKSIDEACLEIDKIKAETERKKIEVERIDQIERLSRLGYTKEEINKILGL